MKNSEHPNDTQPPTAFLLQAENGLRVVTTATVAENCLKDPAKKRNLDIMAERVDSVCKGLGFPNTLPIILLDQPDNGRYCAAGTRSLEAELEIFATQYGIHLPKEDVRNVWPEQKELDKQAPCFIVTSGLLDDKKRVFNWDEFEAVAAHEAGHLLSADILPLSDNLKQLGTMLHSLALKRDYAAHLSTDKPSPAIDSYGGKQALLEHFDAVFAAAGEALSGVVSHAQGNDGKLYAESLIDQWSTAQGKASLLEEAVTISAFSHSLPSLFPTGLPLNRDEVARAYDSAPPEIQDVLEKVHTLGFLAGAAQESIADDVATRYDPAKAQDLFNKMHRTFGINGVFSGGEHFSGAERFARAKMLAENSGLGEQQALLVTNQHMRDLHDATETVKAQFLTSGKSSASPELSAAHTAWTRLNLMSDDVSLEDIIDIAGGKDWVQKVEQAGLQIAHSQRTYTDRIRAEQDTKAEQENTR